MTAFRPRSAVGAPTLQRLGRARRVSVYATSSERGTLGASGFLDVAGLALPVKKVPRRRVRVGGGGAELTYTLKGPTGAPRAVRCGAGGRCTCASGWWPPTWLATRAGAARRASGSAGRARSLRPRRAAHPEPGDADGDEVRDEVDNCPTAKNGSQTNTDTQPASRTPTARATPATRRRRRRRARRERQLPGDANVDQLDTDGDGHGDACPPVDTDLDGVIDDDDNCDGDANPGQSDLDGDDRGDACDRDDDGDASTTPTTTARPSTTSNPAT